ncbi:hypothetical protein FRB99_004282 [Tulasnella sp. 403]|nr:hypothetical protein FRB99_004282 [Tulasnella sp. 403]
MLIRVPPSYDELGTKIKRMEQSARVKEMIKKAQEDEKKKGPKSGEEIMATDKKRRVEQTTMWDEILRGTQKKTKPSTSTSSESGSTAKRSQNPYSKRPSSNISKVVRPG